MEIAGAIQLPATLRRKLCEVTLNQTIQLPRSMIEGHGSLEPRERQSLRSRHLKQAARDFGGTTDHDRLIIGSNRFPAIPRDLRTHERILIVTLYKGIDDLGDGQLPEFVEVFECNAGELNALRAAVTRHLPAGRDSVALPFDQERRQLNAGNRLAREGSIQEKVTCRLLARPRISWFG